MQTGSEMVRGLKEIFKPTKPSKKKKGKKKKRKKSASQASRARPGEERNAGKTVEYVLMPANNDRRFCYRDLIGHWSSFHEKYPRAREARARGRSPIAK